jgi:hypothetical protein
VPRVSQGSAPRTTWRLPVRGPLRRGPYTIGFEEDTDHADLTPFFTGLPDDRCQAGHWGYVLEGKIVYHTKDGDEEFEAGDAYHVGPGHTPEIFPGTKVLGSSPTAELQQTMEVVTRNMESTGA